MRLEINPRGNGACPICSLSDDCRIQNLLASGVEQALEPAEMELVIYACPYFSEREGS
jgi:hypothetical protein